MVQPRKLLVFAFWEFRRILLAISGDTLLDFRAMSLLVFTQACVLLSALEFGSIMLGRRLIPTNELGITAFVLFWTITITAVNHYAVSYKNHWKRYEREFDGYSNVTKAMGWLVMIIMLVLGSTTAIWLTAGVKALPR